jgi:hypothetical protein
MLNLNKRENTLKNLVKLSTLSLALSATSVLANEITFNQRDTVGVSNLTFGQDSGGSANSINFGTSGSMTSVVIQQSGKEDGETSSGNTATVELYTNSDTTQFDASEGATRGDDWKTFSATFDGDNNALAFSLGTAGDSTQYNDVDIDIAVTGDDNNLTHTIANGLSGDSLQFGGIVDGNDNTVVATLGAVGDIAFNYNIKGNENSLTATLAGATGGRTVDINLDGNANVWTATANSTGGILNVSVDGSNITGTNTQGGSNAELQLEVNQTGLAALAITTTQSGANGYADVTVNAVNGGAFTLTQAGANARFVGDINLASGGAATITQ